MIPILTYHKVVNFDISSTWIPPQQFERQMQYLYKNDYTTVTPYELLTPSRQEKQKILITFDDGYESFYKNVLPILLHYKFKAIIFIVANYIGKQNLWDVNFSHRKTYHLSWSQLRELRSLGFEIGSHTNTHPDLTKIAIPHAKKEIFNSKAELEQGLGISVDFISFPFGRYNEAIVELTKEASYKLAFTSNPFLNSPYIVGRMGMYLIDSLANLRTKLHSKGSFYKLEGIKSNLINFFSRGTWIWKSLNPFSMK